MGLERMSYKIAVKGMWGAVNGQTSTMRNSGQRAIIFAVDPTRTHNCKKTKSAGETSGDSTTAALNSRSIVTRQNFGLMLFSVSLIVNTSSLRAQNGVTFGSVKLKFESVCPSGYARNKCAPSAEPGALWVESPRGVALAAGLPRWLEILGTVIDKDGKGTPRFCGNGNRSPFRAGDLRTNVVEADIEFSRELISAGKAKSIADIVDAVRANGTSQPAQLDSLKNGLGIEWDRVMENTTSGRATFRVVEFATGVTTELLSPKPSVRFAACAAQLRSEPNLRLIRAISGYLIHGDVTSKSVNSNLSAAVRATIRRMLPKFNVASIEASMSRSLTSNVKLTTGKRFVAIAATYLPPLPPTAN